jgi:hypothetical protein
MRCGHEYVEPYDPKAALIERSCPKCRSNSIRPVGERDEQTGTERG